MSGGFALTHDTSVTVSLLKERSQAASWQPVPCPVLSAPVCLTRPSHPQDISAMEAVKLDDIDVEAVKSAFTSAKSAYDSAEAGSMAKAEAQIQFETAKSMGAAVGVTM